MNALDQIFGWLMDCLRGGSVRYELPHPVVQPSHFVAVRNRGGHDCRRFPQRIARPAQ
jgi:hypothetical protein